MLRRLLPFWKNARKETAAGGALLVFGAFVDLLQPWPVKWLVDYVFGNHTPPEWLANFWPSLKQGATTSGIAAVCVSILILAIVHL